MKTRSRWYRLLLLLVVPLILRQDPPATTPMKRLSASPLSPTVGALVAPLDSLLPATSFSELAQETLNTLPLRADLEPRGNFHQVPPQVMRGAEAVGRVAEWLEKNEQDREAGKDFFRLCAEKDGVLTAVRALCLKRFLELGGARSPQFSDHLMWIAEQLPSSY